jgi:amidase
MPDVTGRLLPKTRTRMSRRALGRTAAGAAAGTFVSGSILTFPRAASAQDSGDGTQGGFTRREGEDIIVETSVADLRSGLDHQEFTIADIVETALARITAMDEDGPGLNAMIEVNPDAMDIAAQLDEELRAGSKRGPLHGIPVVVKDIFATADSMLTTSGSLALMENVVVRDAFVIEQMRNAGMVILGKTNMSEWSNFRGSGGPNGWSSRGGLTVNPYITTHSAWGSSTGSAVAVAASYSPLGIGGETDGSIICPAAACGVVGLKPTVGLVSRQGVMGNSMSQDSPGPIGRSVRDVAYMLEVLAGYDPEDSAFGEMADSFPWSRFPEFPIPDPGTRSYVKALDSAGLQGTRVGVVRSLFGFDAEVDRHVEDALVAMKEAGAEIVDDVYMESYETIYDGVSEGNVLLAEFPCVLQQFLANYMPDGPVMSIEDIVNFYWENQESTQFYDETDGLLQAMYLGTEAIYEQWYLDSLVTSHTLTREEGIDKAMDEMQLDVLVAPSTSLPADLYGGESFGSSTQIASMAGYPSLTLPVGYSNELPAGMHLFGRAFSERKLLRYAYALEQMLDARRPPEYLTELPGATPIG